MAKKKILKDNGKEILPITHESCVLDNNGVSIGSKIGNINELATDSRTDLVSAINDILQFNSETKDAKQQLVNLLITNGIYGSTSESWESLINKIQQISPGDGGGEDVSIIFDGNHFLCGNGYTFLLKTDGTVWATGNNGYGQLGLGDVVNKTQFYEVNISDVKQIACGGSFTAILKNDGSVWTAGYNGYGQLGLGNNTNKSTFTKVTTNINNDVVQICAGGYHLFAIKKDGTVWCCGKNDNGQLGLGNTTSSSSFKQVTTNVDGCVKIACGYEHTYLLKNNGTVFSCGYNTSGQLGLGSTSNMSTFNCVSTLSNVKDIISGGYHGFVIKNDNTVWSCGYNGSGQLGLIDTESRATFTQVTTRSDNVKYITCGFNHTLVIKNDGTLYVTGENGYGQLGVNETADRYSFTQVPNLTANIIAAYAGEDFSIIIDDEGIVYGAGQNSSGQLGLSDSTIRKSFVVVNQVGKGYNPGGGGSSNNGGLDIISATELPATGKENQICVITDNHVDQFLLSSNYNDNNSNQIVMYLGNTTSGDATKGTLLPITNGGVTTNYYFNKVMLGESRLSSYYYKDNAWTPLTLSYIPLYENGNIMNTSFSGGLQPDNNVFKIGTDYLYIKYDTSYLNGFGFLNKINFTNFSTLKITVKGDSSNTNYLYIAATNSQHPVISVNSFSTSNSIYNTSTSINNTENTVSFNISNWTGEYYLVIAAGKKVSNTYIYNISLY